MSLISLNGKLALITGAASGIGLATAKLFAQNNADLALSDISENVLLIAKQIQDEANSSGKNIKVSGHVCDVSSSEQINKMFDEIKVAHTKHEAANVIVNSAGIASFKPFLSISEQEFDKMMSVHLKGTFLVTQAAVKHLNEKYSEKKFHSSLDTYASIINLSSQAAKQPITRLSHYSTAKAGLLGLTRSLAAELGPQRIRVNAILPSFIETPLIQRAFQTLQETYIKTIPLERFGQPEEVANLILFLASDASSYISGSLIDFAGGN